MPRSRPFAELDGETIRHIEARARRLEPRRATILPERPCHAPLPQEPRAPSLRTWLARRLGWARLGSG